MIVAPLVKGRFFYAFVPIKNIIVEKLVNCDDQKFMGEIPFTCAFTYLPFGPVIHTMKVESDEIGASCEKVFNVSQSHTFT